jgi:hypothetical protein
MTDDLGDRLAGAIDGAAAPVDPAEAINRGKRQVRRRTTVVACITVIAMAAAGVAVASATSFSSAGRKRIEIGNHPVAIDRSWCVPISRDQAIARTVEDANLNHFGPATARAKLVSGSEQVAVFGSSGIVRGDKYWVVELRRTNANHGRYAWALNAIDTTEGGGWSSMQDFGNQPPWPDQSGFDSLPPDHSPDCPGSAAALLTTSPPLSAHIELASTTITAGASEPGYLVVENDTGRELQLSSGENCYRTWAVVLRNSTIQQTAVPRYDCRYKQVIVARGETKLPVTLDARYSGCDTAGQRHDRLTPKCVLDENGLFTGPPLPAGDYEATFFSDVAAHFVYVAPVPVHVVAP